MPGRAGPLVSSMMVGPTPTKDLTGSPVPIFGSGQVSDYQSRGPSYTQFTLDNAWSPLSGDIIPPNTDAHCCILATCQGLADVNNEGGVQVGLFVPGTNLSPIDICSDPHEEQTNITILPLSGHHRRGGLLLGDFAFLSGSANPEQRAQVVVEVTPLAQPNGIDPAVLRVPHVDEAIVWLEKARNANPAHPLIRANLASAYGLKGETERAAAELAEARRLSRDGRFSSIARLKAAQYFGVPAVRALYEATYLVGLRKAGMPEE